MKLALQLAWEHRARWAAMLVLTAVSGAVMILGLHSTLGNGIAMEMQNFDSANPPIAVIISVAATFLIVQSIAALCLESQARDLAVIKTCGATTKGLRRTLALEVFAVASIGFLLGVVLAAFTVDPYVIGMVKSQTELIIPAIGLHGEQVFNAYIILIIAVFVGSWNTLKHVSRQNVVQALQGDSVTTRKRSKVLRWLIGIVTVLAMAVLFVLAFNMQFILDLAKGAPREFILQLYGLPMLSTVLFCVLTLVLLTTVAPNLYQVILKVVTKMLPKSAAPSVQVGFNLARYNAAKYSGSITPIIVFITVVIMIFTAMDASTEMMLSQMQKAGVDTSEMVATNYEAISYLIGPAVVIAIVGSLCTIVMSGRNRIYVNKLAGILGAGRSERLRLGVLEMTGYIVLAAVISCIIMLLAATLVMIGNSEVSGIQQAFMPSWGWWAAAVAISFVFMLAPAFFAQSKANRLESKAVLETFGE